MVTLLSTFLIDVYVLGSFYSGFCKIFGVSCSSCQSLLYPALSHLKKKEKGKELPYFFNHSMSVVIL